MNLSPERADFRNGFGKCTRIAVDLAVQAIGLAFAFNQHFAEPSVRALGLLTLIPGDTKRLIRLGQRLAQLPDGSFGVVGATLETQDVRDSLFEVFPRHGFPRLSKASGGIRILHQLLY